MKNFKKVLTLFFVFSFLVLTSGVSFAGHPGHGKNACNPCAKNACNPCAKNACNPCAKNVCNPCNPCYKHNPCAKNACNPCNPCAKNACNPCAKNACNPYGKWRIIMSYNSNLSMYVKEKKWKALKRHYPFFW